MWPHKCRDHAEIMSSIERGHRLPECVRGSTSSFVQCTDQRRHDDITYQHTARIASPAKVRDNVANKHKLTDRMHRRGCLRIRMMPGGIGMIELGRHSSCERVCEQSAMHASTRYGLTARAGKARKCPGAITDELIFFSHLSCVSPVRAVARPSWDRS